MDPPLLPRKIGPVVFSRSPPAKHLKLPQSWTHVCSCLAFNTGHSHTEPTIFLGFDHLQMALKGNSEQKVDAPICAAALVPFRPRRLHPHVARWKRATVLGWRVVDLIQPSNPICPTRVLPGLATAKVQRAAGFRSEAVDEDSAPHLPRLRAPPQSFGPSELGARAWRSEDRPSSPIR